ncbi:MAG: RHS repeat-associated core domain-containing protein, partial [Pirellulales bacterium]|nr:RHS repeat-associated core domain-containing protein [Pirellulales bacterium]
VERYSYTPYGETVIYDASFSVRNSSSYDWVYLYTGRRVDEETGLYYFRNRYYNDALGRFCSRDPIGYEGTKWGLYEYVNGKPSHFIDPYGLSALKKRCFEIDWKSGDEFIKGKVCFNLGRFCPVFIHFARDTQSENDGVVIDESDIYVPWRSSGVSYTATWKNKRCRTETRTEDHPCDHYSYRNCEKLICGYTVVVKVHVGGGSSSIASPSPVQARTITILETTTAIIQECCDNYERVWGVDPDSGEVIPVKPCRRPRAPEPDDNGENLCEG